MTPGIVVPSAALEGRLYRFTYDGPSIGCRYEYDLRTTPDGYECTVRLRVSTGRAVETIAPMHARDLFIRTHRAMRDIITPTSDWERYAGGDDSVLGMRMAIAADQHEPFGVVATRIINELPRLSDAEITAYYAPAPEAFWVQ